MLISDIGLTQLRTVRRLGQSTEVNMAKPRLGNPYSAITEICKGRSIEEFDLFIRDPELWIRQVEGAHLLASVCRDVPNAINLELSKLLTMLQEGRNVLKTAD